MIDSFYTPPDLADRLIDYIKSKNIRNVIDFCIGNGELIRAVLKKWPNIECFGTDISEKAISSVKELHPIWNLDKCDFLETKSQGQCKLLSENIKVFDLVVLNPPFSCIGGSIHEVHIDDKIFSASTSMKFLVESIKYLSKNGSLFAIMPISIAYSQKDKKLWDFLVANYKLTILEIPNGNYFKNCSPTILFVSINDNSESNISIKINPISIINKDYSIFRGKVSMNTIKHNIMGKYLIHTTNLKNNNIENLNIKVFNKLSEIKGPAVLIPRVGNPNPFKICVVPKDANYTLSDCILAIKAKTIKDANDLKFNLIENWKQVNDLYRGTGARYITIERLSVLLGLKKD